MADQTNPVDKMVGGRAKALRQASGISLNEAAGFVDVSVFEYAQLEAGAKRIKATQLIALSREFGVSAAAFFCTSQQFDAIGSRAPSVAAVFH